MMKQLVLIVVASAIALFGSIHGSPTVAECQQQSNKDCRACILVSGCGFCQTNKTCFAYELLDPVNGPCPLSEQKYGTCVGNFQVWIIIGAVLGAIVLIAVLVVLCCICRKCKRHTVRKEERRQERDNQSMAAHRAEADARTVDRTRVADQIRMKYGILKEKENNTDYARMG